MLAPMLAPMLGPWKVKVAQSYPSLCDPINCPWNSPGQNTVGSLSLLQGIFPTQGLNPGLLHCRQIQYYLSHQGNPAYLEYYINLVDKVSVGLWGLTPVLKEVLCVKCYQTELHATVKLFIKGRVNLCNKLHCSLILRNCHNHLNIQQWLPD